MSGEVLFEFIVQGNVVRVAAVDAASGVEAVIVGDPRMPRRQLEEAARRKLRYVMAKGADRP